MDDVVIRVADLDKAFKLPHENHGSVKSLFLNLFRGRRSYETQAVIKNVSFEVKKGEFFAIVGRNGSGKSTLLKLLAGIYSPDRGEVVVNGKLTPFIELGVGFNPELTGRENIYLNGALLGFNRRRMDEMYDDIVKFAELERFMDQKLKNYSSGMQVRLAFSIAIRVETDILLVDEVLAVGDAAFQQKCFNYFEELKKNQKTVVFISHDMAAVKRFCTRAIYIKDGDLIAEGSAADIASLYTAENIDNKPTDSGNGINQSPNFNVAAKITKVTDKKVDLSITYGSKTKDPLYVGLAILRDGIAVAEITTPPTEPLVGKGKLTFSLDTTQFNAGLYRIDAAMFKVEHRQIVAISTVKNTFEVKGEDTTRGAALKLKDTWEHVR